MSRDDKLPPNNGAILTIATIIKAVMTSAPKAELGAIYLNAKEAVYIRQILTKMGHPQPQTPIQTNNLTAEGVITNKIQPKQTKAMDMRYHWLHDHKAQSQFRIYSWTILRNTIHPPTMLVSGQNSELKSAI
jgi:hypothetical protein